MYTGRTWVDEAGQTVSIDHDVRSNAHRLTILAQNGELVWKKWYYSRESAYRAMRRLSKNRREIVFASDLLKLPRAKLAKRYRAEIDWLEELTAYEWAPGLVPFRDWEEAWVTLDMWNQEGIDDIPRSFLIPHGCELLMVLWNAFIV